MSFFTKLAATPPGSLVKELEEESAFHKVKAKSRGGAHDIHGLMSSVGFNLDDEDEDEVAAVPDENEEDSDPSIAPIPRSTVMASSQKNLREHYFDDTPGPLAAYLFQDEDGHHIVFRRRSTWDEVNFRTRDASWNRKIKELVEDGFSIYEAKWTNEKITTRDLDDDDDYYDEDYVDNMVNKFMADQIKCTYYHTYGPAKAEE